MKSVTLPNYRALACESLAEQFEKLGNKIDAKYFRRRAGYARAMRRKGRN